MAQLAWEKPKNEDLRAKLKTEKRGERLKFLIGGFLILGAIAYLIVSGTAIGQRFFISVEELLDDTSGKYAGQPVRITGAVMGETISETTRADGKSIITFTIVHIPTRTDNLAETLNIAVNNPAATQLQVHVENQPRPELLRHEAQAILNGTMGEDGIFYATELQFKCPSRFEESGPQMGEQDHPGIDVISG